MAIYSMASYSTASYSIKGASWQLASWHNRGGAGWLGVYAPLLLGAVLVLAHELPSGHLMASAWSMVKVQIA